MKIEEEITKAEQKNPKSEYNLNLSKRIAMIISTQKITQRDFAKSINITPAHITRVLSNQKTLSEALISLICKTYNINMEWLKYGIGEIYNDNLGKYKKVLDKFAYLNPKLQEFTISFLDLISEMQDYIDTNNKTNDINLNQK